MSFASRSSYAYREALGGPAPAPQHDDLPRPSIFNPTARLKAQKNSTAATPENRDTITVVSKDPGKKPVQLKVDPKHRALPAEDREFATIQAALKSGDLVKDYHPVMNLRNKGSDPGKARDYSGMHVVGNANVARANGATFDGGVIHAARANITNSTAIRHDAKVNARDANIAGLQTTQPARVDAQDATLGMNIRATTLSDLAGAKVADGRKLALVAQPELPTPHMASIRPGESRRRQLEMMGLAA